MEELNNNLLEETMEVTEPVEVLEEIIETKENDNSKTLAIGAVIVTGVIAGVYGVKKLWDKKKKSKNTTSRVVVEFDDEIENIQGED